MSSPLDVTSSLLYLVLYPGKCTLMDSINWAPFPHTLQGGFGLLGGWEVVARGRRGRGEHLVLWPLPARPQVGGGRVPVLEITGP